VTLPIPASVRRIALDLVEQVRDVGGWLDEVVAVEPGVAIWRQPCWRASSWPRSERSTVGHRREVGPADSYSDNPNLELDAWMARAIAELG
jgi:hypothetical protein